MLSLRVSSDIDVTINREHLYVQCRSVAKCLESLLLLKHTFLPKPFFPEGMGGVQNGSGNSEGVGVILVVKKWKFRGGGGLTLNSLRGGVMDIFWNYPLCLLSLKSFRNAHSFENWRIFLDIPQFKLITNR